MYYMLFHNFLSNILFYLFIYINSQFNSMRFLLIIYSLNLVICLHLAINSLLLFNNFFGSGKSKMCIFSSRKWNYSQLRFNWTKEYSYVYIYIYICVCVCVYVCVCVCVPIYLTPLHVPSPVSWCWRMHWCHLWREVRPPTLSVLDITLNNLMVKLL